MSGLYSAIQKTVLLSHHVVDLEGLSACRIPCALCQVLEMGSPFSRGERGQMGRQEGGGKTL